MNIFPFLPTRLGRRLLAAALLAALAALVSSYSHAYAAEGSQYGTIGQYGEVTRFGGFDATWYDNELYDGNGGISPETEPKSGLFLNPVGFAVDTKDATAPGGTAIYVLDRVSDWPEFTTLQGTEWRLQKLSDTGQVLGVTEFYLPKTTIAGVNVPVGVIGLAIDDNTGNIYTLLYKTTGTGNSATPYADEIIGWSTTAVNGKLGGYSAAGLNEDQVSTEVTGYEVPGRLSTEADLQAGTTWLYSPHGLTLDVTGDQDYLAIQADEAKRSSSGATQGPAVVEQVSTTSGTETATNWSAKSLTTGVPNASSEDATALAAGISTNSDGSLNVLLATAKDSNQGVLDDVKLPADLAGPTVLTSSEIVPSGTGYPHAAVSDDPDPIVAEALTTLTSASTQVVGLSDGLYASDFSSNTTNEGYWNAPIIEGIRLVAPEADGLLSNPLAPVTSVFDTLGNATSGGACYIGNGDVSGASSGVSLAAGANDTVWVLTAGKDSSEYSGSGSDAAFVTDRQIIELSPDGANACAEPSGTFSLAKEGGSSQFASSSLKVTVGSTVDFNASTIEYPTDDGGKPAGIYAYEWDPTLGATGDTGYTTISDTIGGLGGGSSLRPTPTASATYDAPGVYTVGLKLLGDFGEYDETGTVVVQPAEPPTAVFTGPTAAQANQAVSFDASGSIPASGQTIADYHWNFGDGTTDDTQTPTDTHEYSTAGTYTVTLTVRDKDNRESESVTEQITVTSPFTGPLGGGENMGSNNGGSNSGGSGGSSGSTGSTTSTNPPATTSVKPKALTQAQKLANALKSCKKDKPKKKRESCEKQAKKKYAPKPKPKPKKKSKSKKK